MEMSASSDRILYRDKLRMQMMSEPFAIPPQSAGYPSLGVAPLGQQPFRRPRSANVGEREEAYWILLLEVYVTGED